MSGCTKHRAYIYDRGGEQRIGEMFPLTQVRWGRTRDDTSIGNVFTRTPDKRCQKVLAQVEPGRHELVIFRDGMRVWEGPIVRTAEQGRSMEIDARDITHYANRTIMRSAYNNAYPKIGYVTERMKKILVAELARKESLEPPINVLPFLDVRTNKGTAKTSRKTFPYERYVMEELEVLAAKGGLDYTVIGRRLVLNDVHDNIGEGPMLTEADFDGDLVVTAYGMELCTYSAVTNGEGRWGAFGGTDPYYGQIELLHTTFDATETEAERAAHELTTAEMVKQAQRNLSGRFPTPIVLRVPENSTLRPSTASKIMDLLVPGVRFPVRATNTYRQVTQIQKLDKLVITETSAGEKINVTFSPAPGITPWDDGGETSEV